MLLALDISTSIVGLSFFSGSSLISWNFIDLKTKDEADIFDKFDKFVEKFEEISKNVEITEFAVEEALKKISSGASNSNTITKLIAFNVLISNYLRKKLNCKPIYVNVLSARSKCGLKFAKGTTPKQKKEVIASYVSKKYNIDFPKKKTGSLKDHAYDVSDSIIIGESVTNARIKQNKS